MTAAASERSGSRGGMPEIVSIQHLRAIAALTVVAFHALGSPKNFPVGGAGVDVFFVISGFIMWTLTEAAETSPGSFLWRRIVRVAPPYWIATFLTVAIWTLRPHFLWMAPVTWRQVVESLAFIPHRDGWGQVYPVLTSGWTLDYEMFFYVVFGAALILPRRGQLVALTLVFVVLAALGGVVRSTNAAAETYLNALLLEFLAGVWLGRAWVSGRLRGARAGGVVAALALAIFAVEDAMGVFNLPWRSILWGGPAVLLVAGALQLEGAGVLLRSHTLKTLGDSSYSIYLFHPPIVALAERLPASTPTALRVLAALAGSAIAGVVLHRMLERPLTGALRRMGRRAARLPAPAALPSSAPGEP